MITNLTKKPFKALYLCAITSLILFSTCKKPTDGVSLIINIKSLVKAPTLVAFINASSKKGSALPASFAVTISGPDAALVQTDIGKHNFVVSNGLLAISLSKDAAPSVSKPVIFSINANIPGYAPVSRTVTINYDTLYVQTIPVFDINNPVQGLSSLSATTNLSSNITNISTLLTTLLTDLTSKPASITIAAGTQFFDLSANSISASSLQTNLSYAGLLNNLSAILGNAGMQTNNVIGKNGTLVTGMVNFKSAAVLNINMTAGNTAVKSFSKPLTANLELAKGQTNYTTGKLVAAGDTIPLWSQNESTGQWKYEGVASVVTNADGNLAASFKITHLSNWALLYTQANPDYIPAQGNISINCTDKNLVVYPNTWVQFNDVTDPTLSINLYVADGKLSGYLINGHTYTITTTYNGSTYSSGQFTATRSAVAPITGSDFSFSVDYKPDPASANNVNTLFFTGNISGTCN
jgi:hypothetical protein